LKVGQNRVVSTQKWEEDAIFYLMKDGIIKDAIFFPLSAPEGRGGGEQRNST
jgi:hypothetical protein